MVKAPVPLAAANPGLRYQTHRASRGGNARKTRAFAETSAPHPPNPPQPPQPPLAKPSPRNGSRIAFYNLKMRSIRNPRQTRLRSHVDHGKHDPGSVASGYVSHRLCCKNNGFSKTRLQKAPELVKRAGFNCVGHCWLFLGTGPGNFLFKSFFFFFFSNS